MLETAQTVYATALGASRDGRSKLRRTMHAGEHGDPRNVRDALILGAERLGHAVRMREDPVAIEYARTHGIAVEANLVSNDRLGAIDDLDHHPFLFYARLGLAVSFSTDDEGALGTTIGDECVAALRHSDIHYAELRRASFSSIASSFADEALRRSLWAQLETDFTAFERTWIARSGP